MKLLKKYLLESFSQTFFPIFSTLYIIISIIYLVRISALTSVIQINFLELLLLYSYTIPTLIFYTLPISLFVSLALSLSKLSSEYELIVVTSFGLNPTKILKLVVPVLMVSTVFLLINSLVMVPKSDNLYDSFKMTKKQEAQFNIKASEYGQAFGDWLIYVNEEKKGLYKDIVLFKQDGKEDVFIVSKEATLDNQNLSLSLNLKDGKLVRVDEGLNQVDFEKMNMYNELKSSKKINSINDIISYWSDMENNKWKRTKFIFSVLMAFFPLISILFYISFGFYNPRYDKNSTTTYTFILAVLYVIISNKMAKDHGIVMIYTIPILWMIFSYIVYRFKVKPYY